MPKQTPKVHQPVLLTEVLRYLDPKPGESYLDLTAGCGGHAAQVLELTKADATLIDRDPAAIKALKELFTSPKVEIISSDFASASEMLIEQGKQFDMILADLGVSSPHLEQTERGFSFNLSGPLDMRMDSTQELSAQSIVNQWSESQLEELLREYGQEPKARTIARNIVSRRPLTTTDELAAIAARAWPGHSRVHPATRTFQALRIAVNDELGQLERSLPLWLELLKPSGRLTIISFHSLEDRIVKQFFSEQGQSGYEAELTILTKKPVIAGANEIAFNPRARSAKLRAAAKINTKRKEKGPN